MAAKRAHGPRCRGLGRLLLAAATCGAGCGYRSALPAFAELAVPAVTSRAPDPELAACLTGELRAGLALRGVRIRPRAALRLEAEVLESAAVPATIEAGARLLAAEESLALVVRATLLDRRRGPLLGPEVYRATARAARGSGPLESEAARHGAAAATCRDVAERILDDLVALAPSALGREEPGSDPTAGRSGP